MGRDGVRQARPRLVAEGGGADDQPHVIAAALEAAWMDHDEVADVFAETDEIAAALRNT